MTLKSSFPPLARFFRDFMHLGISCAFLVANGCSTVPENVSHLRSPGSLSGSNRSDPFSLSPDEFRRELDAKIFRIEEFKALSEWGAKQNVRIWGAGGTAAGLAIYLKQDLENEHLKKQGKPLKYFSGRFSFNYFDIYRSTQDADIIIDGTAEDAEALESYLHSRFNYLEGSKSVWEVRLLNQSRGTGAGEKDPLLGFDFQNQNSDSFSTGMIEFTTPPAEESRVRDLFDWKNHKDPHFLNDILGGQLSFYESAKHFETKRARAGMNPEILSAIRALTKAFQYESDIRPESMEKIRRIVSAWNPASSVSDYVAGQISKNGQKLYWHSPDVEHANVVLRDLKLDSKLVRFGEMHKKPDLTLWLGREPLRSLPLGTKGKTARELGIEIVAHETNSFAAYENISRSLSGKPNVFISRANVEGEAAFYGSGFYVKQGTLGARGTGLTIRFTLDPGAREGTDFTRHKTPDGDEYIVVKNAAALKVIDESLNLTYLEYFHLLLGGEFAEADRGLLEKLKYKMKTRGALFSPEEDAKISELVRDTFHTMEKLGDSEDHSRFIPMISAWIASGHAKDHPELVKIATDMLPDELLVRYPELSEHPDFPRWMDKSIKANPKFVAEHVLGMAHILKRSEIGQWVDQVLRDQESVKKVIQNVLAKDEMRRHPEFGSWVMRAMEGDIYFTENYVLSADGIETHPEFSNWMEYVLDKNMLIAMGLISKPGVMKNPNFGKWMDRILVQYPVLSERSMFQSPTLLSYSRFDEIMRRYIQARPTIALVYFNGIQEPTFLAHPKYPEWILEVIRRNKGELPEVISIANRLVKEGRGSLFTNASHGFPLTAARLRRAGGEMSFFDRCRTFVRRIGGGAN